MLIPLLHFSFDPCTHKFVAVKNANDSLVCSHPITSLYGLLDPVNGKPVCLQNAALYIVPHMPGDHLPTQQKGENTGFTDQQA